MGERKKANISKGHCKKSRRYAAVVQLSEVGTRGRLRSGRGRFTLSADLLMAEPAQTIADRIDRAVQRVTPFAYRMQRKSRRWMRRALRKPRSVAEGPNLLPVLIQVLASFSKADGVLLEEE